MSASLLCAAKWILSIVEFGVHQQPSMIINILMLIERNRMSASDWLEKALCVKMAAIIFFTDLDYVIQAEMCSI